MSKAEQGGRFERHTQRVYWATTAAMAAGLVVNFAHTYQSTTANREQTAAVEQAFEDALADSEQRMQGRIQEYASTAERSAVEAAQAGIRTAVDEAWKQRRAELETRAREAAALEIDRNAQAIEAAAGKASDDVLAQVRVDLEGQIAALVEEVGELGESNATLRAELVEANAQVGKALELLGIRPEIADRDTEYLALYMDAMSESTRAEFAFLLSKAKFQPAYHMGPIWGAYANSPSAPVAQDLLTSSTALLGKTEFRRLIKGLLIGGTDRTPPALPPEGTDEYFEAVDRLFERTKQFLPIWVEEGLVPQAFEK